MEDAGNKQLLLDNSDKLDVLSNTLNQTLCHMEKLDVIAKAITEMKDTWLQAVLGKEHVPLKTHDTMFLQMAKVNSFIYKVLAAVIIGLLGVIVFLLTGQVAGFIPPLH